MEEQERIEAFLYFGYLPPEEPRLPFPVECLRAQSSHPPDLVARGVSILKNAIARCADPTRLNVVPLSGGLDSRAIVAELSDLGVPVAAVSFGTSGTFDFEFAALVARHLRIRHEAIDLSQIRVVTGALVDAACSNHTWTSVFDSFYNRLIIRAFGEDAVYLSGFMGDPIAGSHSHLGSEHDWAQAIRDFSKTQCPGRPAGFMMRRTAPESVLPARPLVEGLGFYEQLDFSVRQQGMIRPIVIQEDYDYRTPFLDEEWVQFMLNIPQEYRFGQSLYRKVLSAAWPSTFRLPAKNTYGSRITSPPWRIAAARARLRAGNVLRRGFGTLMARRPPLMLNYIDFTTAMRKREDIRDLVEANIEDLHERRVVEFANPLSIWHDHRRKKEDYTDLLLLLVGLEINLKADELGETSVKNKGGLELS